ncbi:MAG: hypothetical protein MK185_10585 [Saccharospirillaceae bacterium]|jgi:hypothetical protein|nr:hypothetical protein A3759_24170 [Thalassolituus sp. HI0120]KZZ41391.1 hypothetical protein A3759_15750 [Thalassolituus sp. HI0120]MCH2041068.1 hypothetical protein [Saccharospirillaceae bacterium]
MLFFPNQQELDCINDEGKIVGKIKFNGAEDKHVFCQYDDTLMLSEAESTNIKERLIGLDSGKYDIPMQDDD